MLAQSEERFNRPFTIEQTRYGDEVLVLALSGELDLAETPGAWEVIEPALAESSSMIVVDLTDLEFIGAKGIAMLFRLARARPDRDSLRLLPSRHEGVNRVLELTDVRSEIPLVSS